MTIKHLNQKVSEKLQNTELFWEDKLETHK